MSSVQLTDSEIERYSRQIIVPGIGASGQARLCAARVFIIGEEAGRRIATLYTRALGCVVATAGTAADVMIVAGCSTVETDVPATCPMVWYALDGTRIVGGIVRPPNVLDPRAFFHSRAATDVMHAIAASDAVATAAALILGWENCDREYTAVLA